MPHGRSKNTTHISSQSTQPRPSLIHGALRLGRNRGYKKCHFSHPHARVLNINVAAAILRCRSWLRRSHKSALHRLTVSDRKTRDTTPGPVVQSVVGYRLLTPPPGVSVWNQAKGAHRIEDTHQEQASHIATHRGAVESSVEREGARVAFSTCRGRRPGRLCRSGLIQPRWQEDSSVNSP